MRNVAIVAHTHWDREWYLPFESFRARLVTVLDELLDLFDSAPGFAHFHLDGQVAMVEDYLCVRPEQSERVAALVAQGRLAVGPWYCLMDEFCVSAETIVRNLQVGLARARLLGASCEVGYLPDMFGHVGQMPQILRSAGIDNAVVWRGVPESVRRTGFVWGSPDGSTVRAEYLPSGYGACAHLPSDPRSFVSRVSDYETEIAGFLGAGQRLLVLTGGDHQGAQPGLPAVVDAANEAQDRFHFEMTDLQSYLQSAQCVDESQVRGELRSNARAPLLVGVLSSRVDIKQAAAVVESALERTAEPLATLWLAPQDWPAGALGRAWLEVIRNSAHDSVCGCSADAVGRAVLSRYDTACELAMSVVDSTLRVASIATASSGTMVLNPSAFLRSGLVELELDTTVAPPGAQVLAVTPGGVAERSGRGRDLAAILAGLAADGWIGEACPVVDAVASQSREGHGLSVSLTSSRAVSPQLQVGTSMAGVWGRAGATAGEPLRVTVTRSPSMRVLVQADDVPGYGWAMLDPGRSSRGREAQPVTALETEGSVIVDNGLLRLEVDLASGSFALNGIRGMNTISEEPDLGDTYNFAPADNVEAVTVPADVQVSVVEAGPLRGVVTVTRTYRWGAGVPKPVEVVSTLDVRHAENVVRVTTSFDNAVRDHRVRVVFPLGERASTSVAECAFATVQRTAPPDGHGDRYGHGDRDSGAWLVEEPPASFPSRRFVTAGRLTVSHRGLLEYSLVEGGCALALTLLRATGQISKPTLATRRVLAGPPIESRDAQMPGPQRFEYAVAPDCRDPWALADNLWNPLIALGALGGGRLADSGSRLEVSGAVVSCLRRVGGQIEARFFNPSDTATTVHVGGKGGTLVDLAGRELTRWIGSFPLGAWKFATARLDEPDLDRDR